MARKDSKSNPMPVWTGDKARDTEALNTYIQTYGKTVGASEKRIAATVENGDRLLEEGMDFISAFLSGTPELSQGDDSHEVFQWLENSVAAQFEGTDEEYFAGRE